MRRYPHVVRLIAEEPWAILPSKLMAIAEVVALRAEGRRLSDEEIVERLGALSPHEGAEEPRSALPTLAVLPLHGSLVPRADMFTRMSGATSMETFGNVFRAAVDNPKITAILLDVDSPGGTVRGTPELAELIYSARGTKPIVAVANTFATSAAYWIGAQADEFVASPSAVLGSIGVVTLHQSFARALEDEGIDVTVVRSGRFKAEANPFEPLGDEALQHLQELSDEAHAKFVGDVARARDLSAKKVMSDFGEGRVVSADDALAVGMIDRIETFEQAVNRLLRHDTPGGSRAVAAPSEFRSFVDEAGVARDATNALVARLASLAEVKDGRLTKAKREVLSACPESLRTAADAIEQVLAATDPDRQEALLRGELLRFERSRLTS